MQISSTQIDLCHNSVFKQVFFVKVPNQPNIFQSPAILSNKKW